MSKHNQSALRRPKSVTFISWFLIVTGACSLLTSFSSMNNPLVLELMAKSPLPVPAQFIMMYIGLAIYITSGIFMLRGANWARFLYIISHAINILIGVATSPVKLMLIPGIIIYGIIVFFLLRPNANAFFSR
jgi:hypothetical protein